VNDTNFAAFVAERQSPLLGFAMVVTGDRHLAQDLVQDALEKARFRWDRISAMARPEAYVKKMIVNGHLSFRRKWSRVRLMDEFDARPAQSDHTAQIDDRQFLAGELSKLPRQQRVVLVLRYYEGLSDPEIAEVLKCSAGTVRGYASRALTALRIELAPPSENSAATAGARKDS
jgi:RNA polymerase sigma-70 factor (sigma-E family)